MASQNSIVLRRANAENGVSEAVSALASEFGVEVVQLDFNYRDVELKRIAQLENLVATLDKVLEAIAESKRKTLEETETAKTKNKK